MYDVIIPAKDEASTVGHVIRAAQHAAGVGKVFVIDDHSMDCTARVAREAGAIVLTSRGFHDKAKALATGVAASSAELIVFFDADITGVQPAHIELLVEPVLHGYAMSCGLIDYGPKNAIFLHFPPITGMRAMHRSVFEQIPAGRLHRFNIEAFLNSVIARNHLRSAVRTLTGTKHRTKIAKRGWYRGLIDHTRMTRQLIACYGLSGARHYWNYIKYRDILVPTHERQGASALTVD